MALAGPVCSLFGGLSGAIKRPSPNDVATSRREFARTAVVACVTWLRLRALDLMAFAPARARSIPTVFSVKAIKE
jgi:hypothetical protein